MISARSLALVTGALLTLAATPARAEHRGPTGIFPNVSAENAASTIASACAARGFAVKQMSPTDVICQAGELVRDRIEFRPSSGPADPRDAPQEYHRFVVEAGNGGAIAHERTTFVMTVFGRTNTIDAAFIAAMMANKRVSEFYRSLGAQIEGETESSAPVK